MVIDGDLGYKLWVAIFGVLFLTYIGYRSLNRLASIKEVGHEYTK
jgi:hypothetical protein